MTQSLRLSLASHGVAVHAALAGPIDTDMGPRIDIPKASPASVAAAIFDGVERRDEEILPDPLAEGWRTGVSKALERQMAELVSEPLAG